MLIASYCDEGTGFAELFQKEEVDQIEVYHPFATFYFFRTNKEPEFRNRTNPQDFQPETVLCREWELIMYSKHNIIKETDWYVYVPRQRDK